MSNLVEKLRTYLRVAQALPQLRRYVVLGMFDGIVVTLSLIITADVGNLGLRILWASVISSLVGVAVASAWNTVQAELLERMTELRKIERTLLRPLRGTVLDRAHKVSIVLCSLVHALSPLAGLVLVVLYEYLKYAAPELALPITVASAGAILGSLGGMYVGELKTSDIAKLSLLMASATIGLVIILMFLFKFKSI